MIEFHPPSPWTVGQTVTLREGERECTKVAESVDSTADGNETQYQLVSQRVWELRQQGVRPYVELDLT